MSGQVGGGDGQVEIPIVGDTVGVREGQLGGGGWLELVIHGPTVTEFIKYLSNVPLTPPSPPAGSAQIRFAEEGGEISPQFEPVVPLSRPLTRVRLGGTQRVGSSA